MTALSLDKLLHELSLIHPCPKDEFEACEWLSEMKFLCEEFSLHCSSEFNRLLEVIKDEDLSSDTFCIVTPEKAERRVDVSKLKAELFSVFDSIVHLKSSDAERFIGRRKLYELARDSIGEVRISPYERVNVQDLEAVLPKDEVCKFVKVVKKFGRPEVRRIFDKAKGGVP